jgi:hypothetical protein
MSRSRLNIAAVLTATLLCSLGPSAECGTLQDSAVQPSSRTESTLEIIRPGAGPQGRAPAEHFTGTARVEGAFSATAPSRISFASVTFEPGARTAWHTHPLGQTLVVTSGVGHVQADGGPIEEIRTGDVAHIPANIRHWHGASPRTAMTHIAIIELLNGERVEWMEHVTDEEYLDGAASEVQPASSVTDGEAAEQQGVSRAQQLLGDIARAFADLTDDVLYGRVWERPELSKRDRSLVTISALIAMNRPDQLRSHIALGRTNGLSPTEVSEAITHLAFYAGWPNAVTAVGVVREVLENERTTRRGPPNEVRDDPHAMGSVMDLNLVYEGAITENVPGEVNIHPVTYSLDGIRIAANVYTPPGYEPGGRYPGVVVAHPNGGVKEQVAGLYAQRLADQGYITIAADAAYQGASGGLPRNVDKPANRIEDIHGMADFISQYPGVDADLVGLLGICGGGGYALKAAQTDKRFRSIATLSMFNSGLVRRNGFQNSQIDTIQERLRRATDARAQEAAGGEVRYAADARLTDEEIAELPFDLYREGYEYYWKTHAHPNSTFRYTMSSLLSLLNFDAATNMDLIDQPLLMMAGSDADTLYMTEEAFPLAINAENKELLLIDGATHIETYWKPEYVNQAMDELTRFFGNTIR